MDLRMNLMVSVASLVICGCCVFGETNGIGDSKVVRVAIEPARWQERPEKVRETERPGAMDVLQGLKGQNVKVEATRKFSVTRDAIDESTVFNIAGEVTQLRTMAWTTQIKSTARHAVAYYTMRYKATGIGRLNPEYDIISVTGRSSDGNTVTQHLLVCSAVINDERFHTVTGVLKTRVDPNVITVQISTNDSKAFLELKGLELSDDVPSVA
jgi:hypothetical protein